MRFHNIVFRAFLMMILIGVNQVYAKKNTVIVENKKAVFSIEFIEEINDFKFGKFLVKIDKKIGDDVEKFADKTHSQKVKILDNQQKYFVINDVDVSKLQLFLLYSSLKLDC